MENNKIEFAEIKPILNKLISFQTDETNGKECLEYIGFFLKNLGFENFYQTDENVDNLYSKLNKGKRRNFCFAGHVDVVKAGSFDKWIHHPFELSISKNIAYGRGMVDMKGAIACYLAALEKFVNKVMLNIDLSLMLTSDEEGIAKNGTIKILENLLARQEKIDCCLIGEPTSENIIGDTIKIGRRGSLTVKLEINGLQGHVAYPHKALNSIDGLVTVLNDLKNIKLDDGDEVFQPSNLEVVKIACENDAYNIIPGTAHAIINIRHIPLSSAEKLLGLMHKSCKKNLPSKYSYIIEIITANEPFFTQKRHLGEIIEKSLSTAGVKSQFSTSGGTSDGRFIFHHCSDLAELGLKNATAHHVNENCSIDDLEKLTSIYYNILIDLNNK